MLTEKSTERTSQPQMKKKGTALLAGFFPQYMHVKKFNIKGDLQNRVKITFSHVSCRKPGIED
jgi:hypothetical protein